MIDPSFDCMVVKIASCIVRLYDFTIYTHGADLRSPK